MTVSVRAPSQRPLSEPDLVLSLYERGTEVAAVAMVNCGLT
jgi:hypothetical protein